MTAATRERGALDGAAATLFWTSALAGLVLPAVAMMLAGRRSPARVLAEFWQSFAGAEPGLVIVTALHAVPFWMLAVFSLLHLGRIPAPDALAPRRLGGALGALVAMTGVSLWGNAAIFGSRSSTAAIGFLFVPAYLLAAFALGYALGRALVRWTRR